MALRVEDIDQARHDVEKVAASDGGNGGLIAWQLQVHAIVLINGKLHADHATQRSDALNVGRPAWTSVSLTLNIQVVRPDVNLRLGMGGSTKLGKRIRV